jgi:hypothetical protein
MAASRLSIPFMNYPIELSKPKRARGASAHVVSRRDSRSSTKYNKLDEKLHSSSMFFDMYNNSPVIYRSGNAWSLHIELCVKTLVRGVSRICLSNNAQFDQHPISRFSFHFGLGERDDQTNAEARRRSVSRE